MMKDITKNIAEIGLEQGTLVANEFVIGYRIYIDVTENSIHLRQDELFNKKNFGQVLDLTKLWESLVKIYNIEDDRLFRAPIREYTLNCIFFDKDCLNGRIPIYPQKGFFVVEVVPKNGIMIYQSKIDDFCVQLRLPYIKTIFNGRVDELQGKIKEIRNISNIASNKISGGVVLKNEPIQPDSDGSAKRWYIAPDYSVLDLDNTESPLEMAKECIRVIFSPEVIFELDAKINIKPNKKKEFSFAMLNYIKQSMPEEYESYKHRCIPLLGNAPDEKFDKILQLQAIEYIEDTVLKLDTYSLLKKPTRKPRKPKAK